MILFTLFWEFFKTGLFSIGGGMATLPFLYNMADKYDWFSRELLIDMIAVSESTPGPIGVNMATYAGYQCSKVLGGVIATMGLIVPSIIIIVIVAVFIEKIRENKYVENTFSILRPAVTGMIAAAGWTVIYMALFNEAALIQGMLKEFFKVKELILFAGLFVLMKKTNKHPLLYIGIAAAVGVIFKF